MNRIFDWNHISNSLSESEVEELKSYYKVYTENVGLLKRL